MCSIESKRGREGGLPHAWLPRRTWAGGGLGVGGVLMYNSNSHAVAETLPQLGCAPLISRI